MKSRVFIVVVVGMGVGLAVLLILLVLKPPVPVAILQVVDASGRPIAGATIVPDGLRPKKGGAHYSWGGTYARSGVEALPVKTDSKGYARVPYPLYAEEKLETGEISFAVDHPDFCADRPFRTVAASPPANAPVLEKLKHIGMLLLRRVRTRPDPVVLKRGALVKLTGYVGSRDNLVTNLQAEISREWPAGTNFWQRSGPVLWSRKVEDGQTFVRALCFTKEGQLLFGEPVSFMAKQGETNEFACELKPGVRLTGRLDESVPRPVRQGRVCIREFIKGQNGNGEAPVWLGWRPLAEDGTFAFESLPEGRVEMIGLTDGFISRNGTPLPGMGTTSHRLPQLFEIAGRAHDLTLAMEPASVCQLTVLDDAGRPLAGATAAFWPNVLWGGNGSTVFADGVFNTEDYFRTLSWPDWAAAREKTKNDFRATSDEQGVATVINMPAGPQNYRVSHTNYDMPINRAGGRAHRSASVTLLSGETNRVTVTMQKKGVESLTH